MSKSLKNTGITTLHEVTFVVIAFNESNGIVNCILSILNQNVDELKVDFSVLVVDDGSTDGTGNLVEKSFNSKVSVLRQKNTGRGLARLKGIENVKTPLIAMVDSDIRLPSEWLTTCLDELSSHAGVGGVALPDGDCTTIKRIFQLTPKVKRGSIHVTGNNSLFRVDALRAAGNKWVTPLGEDFRLNHLLLSKGYTLKTIDNLVVQHIEKKTFREALIWLYKSGVDATRLWLEFRTTRAPDIAAVLFTASIVAIPILAPIFEFWCLLPSLVVIQSVGFGHLASKFEFRTNFLRFVVAALPNTILMLSYLLGRISGVATLMKFSIRED